MYDTLGIVSEWRQDWYEAYPAGNSTDPQGSATASSRVARGSNWNYDAGLCPSGVRDFIVPIYRFTYFGFRVVLAPGR